jgi:hypothetical protein
MNREAFEARFDRLQEITGVPRDRLLRADVLVIAALEVAIEERDRARDAIGRAIDSMIP